MLGKWLCNQRVDLKKGKLEQARQERLESLGVLWDPFEAQWEHNFGLLSACRAREGHADVPFQHEEEGVILGIWLSNQRKGFKKGKLNQARQEWLEWLGVLWGPFEAQWGRNFGVLTQYKECEGHADVPQQHEDEGTVLGTWLSKQRKDFKKSELDQARQ
jgi:hypothetical protein